MKAQSLDKVVITAKEAAKLIGKSQQWVSKLTVAGFIKRGRDNLYRPSDVAQGYIRYLTDEQCRSSKTATPSAVQAARASEIELRIARDQHEHIDFDEAIGVLDEIIGGLKANLDGVAASVTRDAELRSSIEAKIDEVLRRYANDLERRIHS